MELSEIHRIAKVRHESHPNPSPRKDPNDPTAEDRVGVTGEAAFAEAFPELGLKVDDQPRPHGDNGVDFIIEGVVVDVKTHKRPAYMTNQHSLLLWPWFKNKPTDVYVCAEWYADGDAKLIGWADAEHADQNKKPRKSGVPGREREDSYIVPRDRLRPMMTLLSWIRSRSQ